MHKILFYNYIKFQKKEKDGIFKALLRLPIFIIIILVLSLACMLVSVPALIFNVPDIFQMILMIIEFILTIIIYVYTDKYKVDSCKIKLSKFHDYCAKVYTWLGEMGVILNEQNIVELKLRLMDEVKNEEAKRTQSRERCDKWIQVLIIPIFLAVFTVIIKAQNELNKIIKNAFIFLILISFIAIIIFAVRNVIDFFSKRELELLKNFANDLQGVLDTQFENRLINMIEVQEISTKQKNKRTKEKTLKSRHKNAFLKSYQKSK